MHLVDIYFECIVVPTESSHENSLGFVEICKRLESLVGHGTTSEHPTIRRQQPKESIGSVMMCSIKELEQFRVGCLPCV